MSCLSPSRRSIPEDANAVDGGRGSGGRGGDGGGGGSPVDPEEGLFEVGAEEDFAEGGAAGHGGEIETPGDDAPAHGGELVEKGLLDPLEFGAAAHGCSCLMGVDVSNSALGGKIRRRKNAFAGRARCGRLGSGGEDRLR
jgi:hypothetical protein